MPITLRAGGFTDQGTSRDYNEDAVAIAECCDVLICVVTDGVGGLGVGPEASELAVSAMLDGLSKTGRDRAGVSSPDNSLRSAFRLAHGRVCGIGAQPFRGGCCATVLFWPRHDKTAWFAHLGDTAAERLRAERIERLTAMHDLIGVMATQHGVSYEEMRSRGKWRNVLCYFLGMPDVLRDADVTAIPLAPGDRFLLASDGVWGHLEDGDKARLLTRFGTPSARAERICVMAMEHGSRDNVAAIVVVE